ncbi:hypothetical protein [Thalassobacillus pellis]|uniref:hypothetical protein n=1 Tax=Thalassobacillus pellis TaxID=748008 RepID=UPI00195FD029|nr:hypothetical protein [Thalassobacillus pellis]MBM7554584.1 hypothetical protein [Thalassobacillus pellis]
MKKIGLSFIVLALGLIIPFSSANASSGWDYMGVYKLIPNAYGNYDTWNVRSTGGSFKVESFGVSNNCSLMEYDPGSNNDDRVGHVRQNTTTIFNVRGFVDGSNNRAELYVMCHTRPSYYSHVEYWD